MSKKPRPKKKYRPRAVAVPTYINSLSSDVDHGKDAREEDRVFLLQVANRTVEKVDLAMYGRIMQPENRGIYTQSDSSKKSSRNIWSLAVVSVDQRY